MVISHSTRALCFALLLGGCLEDPKLKTCAEFEIGTEGCGSGCEQYCGLMVEHCPDTLQSGAGGDGAAACEAECVERFATTGTLGDLTGDTLQCRIEHAHRAGKAPENHCTAASVAGGICVDETCSTYCDLVLEHCVGAYPSKESCLGACIVLPRGSSDDQNSVECRLKYARQARTEPGGATCEAASLNGGGTCGEPCDSYCDLVMRNCADEHALYADRSECKQICSLMRTDGSYVDWDTSIEADNVQCRAYHAGLPAELAPATHCPHAAIYDDAHCGKEPCPVFCELVARNCPQTYADEDECMTACADIDSGDPPFPFDDSFECRGATP